VDQALVYLDHQAKELVEAGRPIPIHKEDLEVQIFVDPKDAKAC